MDGDLFSSQDKPDCFIPEGLENPKNAQKEMYDFKCTNGRDVGISDRADGVAEDMLGRALVAACVGKLNTLCCCL